MHVIAKLNVLRFYECDGYFVTLSIALRPEVHTVTVMRSSAETVSLWPVSRAASLRSPKSWTKSHPWIPGTIVRVYDCPAITGVRQSLRGLSRFHLRILSSRRAIWIKEDRYPRPGPRSSWMKTFPWECRQAVHRSLRRLENTQFNRHRAWRICSGGCSRLRDVDIITVVSCCQAAVKLNC